MMLPDPLAALVGFAVGLLLVGFIWLARDAVRAAKIRRRLPWIEGEQG